MLGLNVITDDWAVLEGVDGIFCRRLQQQLMITTSNLAKDFVEAWQRSNRNGCRGVKMSQPSCAFRKARMSLYALNGLVPCSPML